jgi:hypothetical protein
MSDTLYGRLGGYDAIAAVADDLLARLQADAQLARFWQNRADDSVPRGGEVCRDAGKAVRISVSVLSAAGFGSPLARDERDLPLPSRSKERSWPQNCRQSRECGLKRGYARQHLPRDGRSH